MNDLVGDARPLSPSAQEALRLRAAAALFGVSLKAVDKWWASWPAGGREALPARSCGRRIGDRQVLSQAEQQAVRQAVLDTGRATWGQVGALIAKLHRAAVLDGCWIF
ncbi:helix-turn-helix domain-containing protein [Streptomyces sp. NPDC050448]|uniref:helix-turn-helix domain-containing protein n=1 Tax=Streptomyces sp. NPDC050448 TaxID=3155404 RepID=UPI003448D4EF